MYNLFSKAKSGIWNLFAKENTYKRWIMLPLLILSGLWFYLLEQNVLVAEYNLYVRLDDYIPFVPAFVIPYILWYPYTGLPGFFLFFQSSKEFMKTAAFLLWGMIISCTVYTLFPNGQELRPENINELEGIFVGLIRSIYGVDTPTNSAPSIHVIYSVCAHIAIYRYNNQHRRILWINIVSLILSASCILSTVFIKQHSVVDLVAGLFVSALLYFAIYIFPDIIIKIRDRKKAENPAD